MLRLWLLRHAKSAWDDPALDDFARPLSARGKKACRALARHMGERAIYPDLVLCSPATRTRQTWERLEKLLEHYNREATPYLSRAIPFREGETDGDYDHLARVLEWSAGGDGPDAEAEE